MKAAKFARSMPSTGMVASAAWTGKHCVEWCGSVGESGVSVAGNMLSNDQVAIATLAGFKGDPGASLPERMLDALEKR